ncbi:MAG: hypothetical protein PHH14_00130 [Candidatus Margulisbacteria bacterium]|nr:hypothetical protein [Candidatus Margulisiibacteriota bacterium]
MSLRVNQTKANAFVAQWQNRVGEIAPDSVKNLKMLFLLRPKLAVGLYQRALSFEHSDYFPQQTVITRNVLYPDNLPVIEKMISEPMYFAACVQQGNGVLDTRKFGLRRKVSDEERERITTTLKRRSVKDKPAKYVEEWETRIGAIGDQTKTNLTELFLLYPQEARNHFKTAKMFRRSGEKPFPMVLPEALLKYYNSELRREVLGDPFVLAQHLRDFGLYDLRVSGYRTKPQTIDLTADLPEAQLFAESRAVWEDPEHLNSLKYSEEIGNSVLIRDLGLIRMELLDKPAEKIAAEAMNDQQKITDIQVALGYVFIYFNKLVDRFPFGEREYRQKIKKSLVVARELAAHNNLSAAVGTISSVYQLLQNINIEIRDERLRNGRKHRSSGRHFINRPEETEIRKLRWRYDLKIRPDGTWEKKAAYYQSAGPVRRQGIIPARVHENDVVRQMGHILENISRENAEILVEQDLLTAVIEKQDLKGARLATAELGKKYENVIDPEKLIVKDYLFLALRCFIRIEEATVEAVRERNWKNAAHYIDAALYHLNNRLRSLESQYAALEIKDEAIRDYVESVLQRDTDLRIGAQQLLEMISGPSFLYGTKETLPLMGLLKKIVELRDNQLKDKQVEYGMKYSQQRFDDQIIHLASAKGELKKLMSERLEHLSSIKETRETFKASMNQENEKAKTKKGYNPWPMIEKAQDRASMWFSQQTRALGDVTGRMLPLLEELARQIALIEFDIEKKYIEFASEEERKEQERLFLESRAEQFKWLAELKTSFAQTVNHKNSKGGKILQLDKEYLGLRF